MRHAPSRVRRVAMESAAELIEHSARRDFSQGVERHRGETPDGRKSRARARARAPGNRKIAAPDPSRILPTRDCTMSPVPPSICARRPSSPPCAGRFRLDVGFRFSPQSLPLRSSPARSAAYTCAIRFSNGSIEEFSPPLPSGPAARPRWHISRREEQRAIGHRETRQRPSARAGQIRRRILIVRVDVRTLVAIDLYRHELAVQHRRHFGSAYVVSSIT